MSAFTYVGIFFFILIVLVLSDALLTPRVFAGRWRQPYRLILDVALALIFTSGLSLYLS